MHQFPIVGLAREPLMFPVVVIDSTLQTIAGMTNVISIKVFGINDIEMAHL